MTTSDFELENQRESLLFGGESHRYLSDFEDERFSNGGSEYEKDFLNLGCETQTPNSEFEVEEEFHTDQHVEQATDKEPIVPPEIGMKFSTEDEVFEFFKKYAKIKGFSIKKRSKVKNLDGHATYITISCCREGSKNAKTTKSLNPRPSCRLGCQVKICAKFELNGFWKISKVQLDHNHDITPTSSRYFKCNRTISNPVKRQLELCDKAGITANKNFHRLVVEAGGYDNVPFTEKDVRNYLDEKRRERFGKGDAESLNNFFLKMVEQRNGFFFQTDLDEDGRLKNVFWTDGRSREAYKEFGDVITFDTTYKTNRYEMPFAPFVGVNHHGQSILFGFGLITKEDTESFVWLFTAWLECMDNVAPKGIITDQDAAMKLAIEKVFPNTRHRWCPWHIMKKLPNKFGSYTNYEAITTALKRLVFDIQIVEEFEKKWYEMINTFQLHNNEWLQGLYGERRRWVPCFVKPYFWAGMSSTQRSEGINAFFDGYLNSKTTLKQFVEQCVYASKKKIENEKFADFKSFSQMVPCLTTLPMEKQIQNVYTIAKFQEFQSEITGKIYCYSISTRETHIGVEHKIGEEISVGGYSKNVTFIVLFMKPTTEVRCSCHLFEFKGIVCRHALLVLQQNRISLLPEIYIVRRWRKDVRRSHTKMVIEVDGQKGTVEELRYNILCRKLNELADFASEHEDHFLSLSEWVDNALEMYKTSQPIASSVNEKIDEPFEESNGNINIHDPVVTTRKGRPREKRLKPIKRTSRKTAKGDTLPNTQ